jgi:hypothetical protein
MSTDYKWMSQGGLLLDGNGDIAFTSSDLETTVSMVRTRLKAATDGWQAYPGLGAGLENFRGQTSNAETELSIQRTVLNAISAGYLPQSMFTVNTLRIYGQILIFVFLNNQMIASSSVPITGG